MNIGHLHNFAFLSLKVSSFLLLSSTSTVFGLKEAIYSSPCPKGVPPLFWFEMDPTPYRKTMLDIQACAIPDEEESLSWVVAILM